MCIVNYYRVFVIRQCGVKGRYPEVSYVLNIFVNGTIRRMQSKTCSNIC